MPEVQPAPAPAPERVAAHVVTSENREEFLSHRLDLAKPAPAAAPVAVEAKAEPAQEEVKPAPEAKEAEAPKPEEQLEEVIAEEKKPAPDKAKKQQFSARMSELTERRKAAEAEAAKERAAREKAEKEAAELKARLTPPAEDPGDAPQRSSFETEEAYQDARVDYRVKKELAEKDKKAAEAREKDAREARDRAYGERLAAVKAEVGADEFNKRIEAQKDLKIPVYIAEAMLESEIGPRLTLHFADHPAEMERLSKLTPPQALREFGKIEAMIETQAKEKPKQQPAPPEPKDEKPSAAPAPITPLKAIGVGEAESALDSSGNFKGTYAQWKALRRAGKIK